MGILLIPVIALPIMLIVVFSWEFLRRYSRPERLKRVASEMSWDYWETYTFPADVQEELQKHTRLFSREFYCITPINNALVGKISGLDAILFDCPVKVVNKFVAEDIGYSEKAFVGDKYSRLSNRATVFLLKTKNELPRFFIGKHTWADRYLDPIMATGTFSILGDDREALQLLMQPSVQKYYTNIGDLSVEGNRNYALFYYLSGSRLKRGYLAPRKDYVFDLISEAEFLIETFNLGTSWEEKIDIA